MTGLLTDMETEQLISLEEVKKHTKEEDCWLVINGTLLYLDVVCLPPTAQPGGHTHMAKAVEG